MKSTDTLFLRSHVGTPGTHGTPAYNALVPKNSPVFVVSLVLGSECKTASFYCVLNIIQTFVRKYYNKKQNNIFAKHYKTQ